MASNPKKLYTPEEYLAMEREALNKSEYLDGVIFAMSGASEVHILIETNVIGELRNQLRGTPCRVYTSNMKVDLSKHGMYAYPDALVVCGETQFRDKYQDNLINPVIIIEILSKSTEAYDRGEKFARYRRLKSLKDYILISQYQPYIEHYEKQGDNRWAFSEVSGLHQSIQLPSIECMLALSDIYENVRFVQKESEESDLSQ